MLRLGFTGNVDFMQCGHREATGNRIPILIGHLHYQLSFPPCAYHGLAGIHIDVQYIILFIKNESLCQWDTFLCENCELDNTCGQE